MTNLLKRLLISTSPLACSKSETAKPEPPSASPAAPEATRPKPLSAYLDGAVAAKVFAMQPGAGDGVKKTEVEQLDETQTKDYLARVGLAQRADAGLVKCPGDTAVELTNAAGTLLGTIGYCKEHARFDAPDGTFGGIKPPSP
jgi:hypothetical protein